MNFIRQNLIPPRVERDSGLSAGAVDVGRAILANDPTQIISALAHFTGVDQTKTLSRIEASISGLSSAECAGFLETARAGREALAAAEMKRLAGQINVTIHALGILLCLPHILEPEERVEYVSLGAGNTGRAFDLETNLRVAEFKFIRWRGADSIRQNSVFKDFVLLAEHPTAKRKFLYLLGTDHALKFFRGGRSIASVLSRNETIRKLLASQPGDGATKVRDYFSLHSHAVEVVDVSPWLSELAGEVVSTPGSG